MSYPDSERDLAFFRSCGFSRAGDFFTPLDMQWGLYVFSRPPGVRSPDDSSHPELIVGEIR